MLGEQGWVFHAGVVDEVFAADHAEEAGQALGAAAEDVDVTIHGGAYACGCAGARFGAADGVAGVAVGGEGDYAAVAETHLGLVDRDVDVLALLAPALDGVGSQHGGIGGDRAGVV